MSFSLNWLQLREPADHAARDAGLLQDVSAHLAKYDAPVIVDVGCGAGSNVRALQNAAPERARWRLLDNDIGLLKAAAAQTQARTLFVDLAKDDLHIAFAGADLVTAAAFFDLVSNAWIDRFIASLPKRTAIYAALNYNGEEKWTPPHPDDAAVLKAFCAHQATDKGFGPALGPQAAQVLADKLRASGREVKLAPSPWRLKAPQDAALMAMLADGVAQAAQEIGQDAAAWRTAPRESCEIGHWDLFASPAA